MKLENFALPALGLVVLSAVIWTEQISTTHVEPGPVHVTYWEKWTAFEGDAIKDVVDTYNKSQNEVHVDLLTVSSIERKTLLATAGDNPPDIAGLYGPNVAQYADDNAVMQLDDLCKEYGIKAENYIPAYWEIGFYKNHVWSLPTTPASTALHISKKMLREAGIDPNKPPVTLEEMDAISDKILKRDSSGQISKSGFLPAEPGWWNWGWGCFFGGKLWDGDTKLTANSPENIRGFEWVQSWSKRYGKAEIQTFKSGFGNFSSPQNAYLSGKVAMELQGVWMYNYIDKYSPMMEKPVREWAAVPFPYPADRPDLANTAFVDEDVVVIPRGAKHPKEAFKFLAFLQSQKGMEQLCMGQRKHSPLLETSPDFYAKHPNPFIKLFTSLARSKNAVAPPKIGIWPEYSDEMKNAFDDIALMKKTPKEALDYVQARMQPKFDEYRERVKLREEASKR